MKELKIIDLYEKQNTKKLDSFSENLSSNVEVSHSYSDYVYDDAWISLIEDGVKYIENIFRNPNRFIINEEDIVKIELARKITVDSIKHLSKNTNFIQDIDEKTGDVMPSKILNINKEESFNTYENRFIYSLIRNLEFYVERKKQFINNNFAYNNDKDINYNGSTIFSEEKVDISISLNSKVINSDKLAQKKIEIILERIKTIENRIVDLKQFEVFSLLSKANISLVTSPIKKTNMILKNLNFQKAVDLWNFLQTNLDDNSKIETINKEKAEDEEIKTMIDEIFLMNYIVSKTLDNQDEDEKKKVVSEYLISNLVQKLVNTNVKMGQKELTDMITKEFVYIKNKDLVSTKEIKGIFKDAIKDYKKSMTNNLLKEKK